MNEEKETSRRGEHQQRQRMCLGRRATCTLLLCLLGANLAAKELQPRAYIPSPAGMNYFGIAYSFNSGGLLFDPSLPVTNAHVDANIVSLMFGQTLGVLGRTAQVLVVFPYGVAYLNGQFSGAQHDLYRSGMVDGIVRYAMNIYGAPATDVQEYRKFQQKTIVGASVTVSVPIGQYDPNKLINIGTNRWGFKPELGVSTALGKWTLEGDAGVWLYTANDRFNGIAVRTQDPLGSLQAHLIRTLPRRWWVSFDGTYFPGVRTQINGRNLLYFSHRASTGSRVIAFAWESTFPRKLKACKPLKK